MEAFAPSSVLAFDDSVGTQIQDNCGVNNTGGTFAPTDGPPADTFTAPAPPPPYVAAFSQFVGAAPNGTWTLFVVDDTMAGGQAIFIGGGWSLDVTTTPPVTTPPTVPVTPATPAKKCKKGKKLKKGKCVKKKRK